MAIAVNRLTNGNLYVDGTNYLGKVSELELPTVTQKMADHVALGMIGSFQLPSGVESMEAKILWNAPYADALKVAADPNTVRQLQIRGNLEQYDSSGRSAQVPYKVFLSAQFKSFPGGNFKQHENIEMETMLNVLSMKVVIDTEQIIEIDVLANIYKAGGVDLLEQYRINIGQ